MLFHTLERATAFCYTTRICRWAGSASSSHAEQHRTHMRNNIEQAVLVAFADEVGRSEEDLLRLGSGFGSGMGTMVGTCGALVDAIMVLSLLSEKGAAMAASRAIMPRFKELCGATICRDLKGIDTGKVLCSCENCVRNAVRAAGESLAKD